jgi:hypothetical protein
MLIVIAWGGGGVCVRERLGAWTPISPCLHQFPQHILKLLDFDMESIVISMDKKILLVPS